MGRELSPNPRRRLASSFGRSEKLGLVRHGTSLRIAETGDCSATLEELFEDGTLPPHVHFLIEPEDILWALSQVVYVFPEEEGEEIELPYVEITVASEKFPVIDPMSGNEITNTAALIEFSYEDARLSEEIHRIRNESHPLFVELSRVLQAPVYHDVVAY